MAKAAVAAATAVVKDLAKGAKVATVVEVVAKAVAVVDSERTRSRGAPQQELLPVAGGIDAPSPSLFLFVSVWVANPPFSHHPHIDRSARVWWVLWERLKINTTVE